MKRCSSEEIQALMAPVDQVLNEDLESLSRLKSVEQLRGLWMRVKEVEDRLFNTCILDPKVRRIVSGDIKLALLKIAAALRRKGIEEPGITDCFREEEYRLIEDFESMKELDQYTVDEIVELIRRREGRVYEIVKTYYERQYNLLDRNWAGIIGDLAAALARRYRERREKIEEAVVRYIRRYGLSTFITELEEAVKRSVEADRLRESVLEEVERILNEVEKVKDPYLALTRLRMVEQRIERLLEHSREFLKRLDERFSGVAGELVKARRREVEELILRLEDLLRVVRERRRAYQLWLEESEVGSAKAVSREEVRALTTNYLASVKQRLAKGYRIMLPGGVTLDKPLYIEEWSLETDSLVVKGLTGCVRKGFIRRKLEPVIKVACVYRKRVENEGFDDTPLTTQEVLEALGVIDDGHIPVVALASMTGFSPKALEIVNAFTRLFYLVDLGRKEVHHRDTPEARVTRWVVSPVPREQVIEKALDKLISKEVYSKAYEQAPARPMITLRQAAELTGFDEDVIREAFKLAEERGYGRVKEVSGTFVLVYNTSKLRVGKGEHKG